MSALLQRLRALRVMAFDVDGVLTDGSLIYSDTGAEAKAFDVRDGQGMSLLRDAGIQLALISARRSAIVERRARELGVQHCFLGVAAKLPAFQGLLAELKLDAREAGYMGDDLLDLPVLTRAGFAASVPAAPAAVRSRVHYIAARPGGGGAVREVCELILESQGRLEELVAGYLK
ncbi:MAG: phenylphosphate carboxylase subunit delta [Burkholderiales bacterium]|nr:phenylphosphate carboxylase subunit delta [Burkholderiales bacterium]